MFYYNAFCLQIASERELSGLLPGDDDITIPYGFAPEPGQHLDANFIIRSFER